MPSARWSGPRTKKRKTRTRKQNRVARYCGDCGYELASDADGKCPMCPRFQQIRMDFQERRTTGAERVGSTRAVSSLPVIRNPELRAFDLGQTILQGRPRPRPRRHNRRRLGRPRLRHPPLTAVPTAEVRSTSETSRARHTPTVRRQAPRSQAGGKPLRPAALAYLAMLLVSAAVGAAVAMLLSLLLR